MILYSGTLGSSTKANVKSCSLNPTSSRTNWGKWVGKSFAGEVRPWCTVQAQLSAVLSHWISLGEAREVLRAGDPVLGEAERAGQRKQPQTLPWRCRERAGSHGHNLKPRGAPGRCQAALGCPCSCHSPGVLKNL